MTWEVQEDEITVRIQPFLGFRQTDADLLFVTEAEALEVVYRKIEKRFKYP